MLSGLFQNDFFLPHVSSMTRVLSVFIENTVGLLEVKNLKKTGLLGLLTLDLSTLSHLQLISHSLFSPPVLVSMGV